jgi:hypothetical protein
MRVSERQMIFYSTPSLSGFEKRPPGASPKFQLRPEFDHVAALHELAKQPGSLIDVLSRMQCPTDRKHMFPIRRRRH